MNGKTEQEIVKERSLYIELLKNKYADAEIIDSVLELKGNPIEMLGESIKLMANADAIYFMPGALTKGRGCVVECVVAKLYGIKIIDPFA